MFPLTPNVTNEAHFCRIRTHDWARSPGISEETSLAVRASFSERKLYFLVGNNVRSLACLLWKKAQGVERKE